MLIGYQCQYLCYLLNNQFHFVKSHNLKMKAVIVLALLACVAIAHAGAPLAATYVSRAPQFDSAVIKSDRLGGNFAYSVAENHAYAAHTPIVQSVATPVAVSYAAAPLAYAAPVAPAYGYSAPAAFY